MFFDVNHNAQAIADAIDPILNIIFTIKKWK
jgi:hypothetical protein